MNAQTWQLVRELFDMLVDLPYAQRQPQLEASLLTKACAATEAERAAIQSEVLAMLAADAQNLLNTNVDALAPQLLSSLSTEAGDAQHQELTGLQVGPFCLERELGRGGMGTVWLANRVGGEFAQQVAIKLIQPGWHPAETNARFRAERQILAGLTHPNIAHLLDGGVTLDGRQWLALEYVDGLDLSQYCDQNRLNIRQRLDLFLTVCDAVSYAHARLIVHRDLKPTNLLINKAGIVKLLDFGIAKLIAADAGISQTRVFTPEYAAPEQVRGEVMTTSVDIYALGLLLYGLLTGRRPYKLQNATPAAYERAILEQEPTKPSAVLAHDSFETRLIATTGTNGSIEPDNAQLNMQPGFTVLRLRRELKGDLDAIVLKALRKNPIERYASVADFAADISNYLARRPVLARRGGLRYRTLQFMRRHGLIVGISSAAVLALLGGLFAALHQRDLARVEARKSEIVLEFMVDNFKLADLGNTNGAQITARELLDRGAERVSESLSELPEAKAQMLETMGQAYIGLGLYEKSLALLETAIALRRQQSEPVTLAYAYYLKASALKSLTRNPEASQTLAMAQQLVVQFPNSSNAKRVEAKLAKLSGLQKFLAKDYVGAVKDLTHSIALSRMLGDSMSFDGIDASLTLSRVLSSQKEFVQAGDILNQTVTQLRAEKPARTQLLAEALDALGASESKRMRFPESAAAYLESAELHEQVLGKDHWYVAVELSNYGGVLNEQKLFLEAIAPLERSVRIAKASLPKVHGLHPVVLRKLAVAHQGVGEYEKAKETLHHILTLLIEHPEITKVFDAKDIQDRIKANEQAQLQAQLQRHGDLPRQ